MKKILFASLLLFISSYSVATQEVVGNVILSFGQNTATSADGSLRPLKRKSPVYSDDLLITSEKGRLQIRFTDDSRLSLKPNTEFKITEYRFDDANPEEGKAIYKLLKGGMRTISGQIGKVDREDYKLDAVVATIGIRGTDFTVNRQGDRVTGSVNSGRINVTSVSTGESRNINPGRSFEVAGSSGQISERKTPPSESSEESSDTATDETSDEQSEEASEEQGQEQNQEQNEDSSNSSDTSSTSGDSSDASSSDSVTTVSVSNTTNTTGNSTSTNTSIAADPNAESAQTNVILGAPNPTGNGSAAPEGAIVAVAFNENDATKGIRSSNGAVIASDTSAITVDNGAVTGLYYVDPNPSSTDACAPCTFTGPSSLTPLEDPSSTTAIDGVTVSWGRWNSGYEIVENGTTQSPIGSFHFMYADSLTPASVIANKSGQILYTFNGSSTKLTAPESENGAVGSLTGFSGSTLSSYQGTYIIVNWDDQTIDRVRIKGVTGSGGEARNFSLTEETNAGVSVKSSFSSVLNGGSLKVEGTCNGGDCATSTNLSGNVSIDVVGSNAGGAVTSYGATGTNSSSQNVTFTGTVLLEESGAVTP